MRMAASGNVHFAVPCMEHMNREMGGSAKTKESHPITRLNSGNPKPAKTGDAGAEQRRGVKVIELRRDGKTEITPGEGIFRVAAIHAVACKSREVAQILHVAEAVG